MNAFRRRLTSVTASRINPASSNSERPRSGPVLRCRHAPPDHQIGAIDDRLFDNMAFEFDSHDIRVSGCIVPQGQGPDVGIVACLFPAWPVCRASLEPSSVLAATVNTVEVRLLTGAGVQQDVRVIPLQTRSNDAAIFRREAVHCRTLRGVKTIVTHRSSDRGAISETPSRQAVPWRNRIRQLPPTSANASPPRGLVRNLLPARA